MTTHFSDLDLMNPLLEAVRREGYDTPTPVQAKAIPPALEGRDILACAQTGTGKTAAFTLPLINRLMTEELDKTRRGAPTPRALVLSPTRELANQIDESLRTYGRGSGLHGTVVVGGVSQFHQVRALRRGVDVLVATPGRLIDLMQQGEVDLSEVGIFVLDEADRMLDMGFIQPIRQIAKAVREDRQTMLFSATMPKAIEALARTLLRDPVRIDIAPQRQTTELIEQSVYMVRKAEKPVLMQHLLDDPGVERAVIFTRTKHGADKLTKKLSQVGTTATAIHGNKPQRQRQRALESFRDGRSRVLVATDVAARGLDVDGITHVFNFDLPNEAETYVHRIGRTGRAGATGVAVSLCDGEERGYLRAIERLTKATIDRRESPEIAGVTPVAQALAPKRTERAERPTRSERTTRSERRERTDREAPGRSAPRAKKKAHRKGQSRTEDARTESTPKRKPRRRGGPGWGIEQSANGGAKPQGGAKKKTGVNKKRASAKRGAARGPAKGPAGKPGSGVKRVRRSDLLGSR